ncbi:MAG: hypothetical protein R3Y65_00520 [Bacillota bacterium]
MSGIREIYYGNVSGYDMTMPKEWHDQRKRLIELDGKLEKDLTSEQKDLLDRARRVMSEMTNIERQLMYESAFKVGVSIGYESREGVMPK